MNFQEALLASLNNLAAHKMRTVLTMLGIIFGVGAVIAMLSIGAGAERQALETISRLGLNNVIVRAKQLKDDELQEIRAQSLGVSLRDAEAIANAVPGLERIAPKAILEPYSILSAEGDTEAPVYGVSHVHDELISLELSEGRFLDALDTQQHSQVAVLGHAARRDLFGYLPAVGQQIKINDVWLEVIGVLAPSGGEVDAIQGVQLSSTSTAIYLPVTTVLRKFDRDALESPLSEIIVRMEKATSGRATAEVIDQLLQHLHAGAKDYELVVPEALLAESRRTQRLFNLVMGCIAGISLLVGGIGIMNIMLATILERTREIGIRRAVGARKRDIRFQFMVESFALSAFGGLIGVVMGILIARVVAASADWPTVVTLSSILLATGVAMAVGLTSGLYPALRAAEVDPIESLRYE